MNFHLKIFTLVTILVIFVRIAWMSGGRETEGVGGRTFLLNGERRSRLKSEEKRNNETRETRTKNERAADDST